MVKVFTVSHSLPMTKDLLEDMDWVESRHQPGVMMSQHDGPVICQTCGLQLVVKGRARGDIVLAVALCDEWWSWIIGDGWYCPKHREDAEERHHRELIAWAEAQRLEAAKEQKRAAILRRYGVQVRRDAFEQRIIELYGDD